MSATWFKTMRARNMQFPDHYLVFDCETTGLQPGTDLVVQLGYCVVADRVAVARGSAVLDWTREPGVDQGWLLTRMATTKAQMEAKGKVCHFTYDRLRQEGCNPRTVLDNFHGLLADAKERGDSFLGHNVIGFDIPMLHAHFSKWGQAFAFDGLPVFDTGLMEKASQLHLYPLQGESGREFYLRIYRKRAAGVNWSLDSACIPKYGIDKEHNLDLANAHDASFDCLLTHLLFEKFRALAEEPDAAEQKQPAMA